MTSFDVPEDARYTCQRCASCCRTPWHVYLTPDDQARIMSHDWVAESPRLAGQQLYDEFTRDGQRGVRLTKLNGACAFLEEDNLCLIHKVWGFEKKPTICQVFPYNFAATPQGRVAVTLDFACSSVLAGDGAPIATDMADVEGAFRAAGRTGVLGPFGGAGQAAVPTDLALQPKQPLHWENYRLLEQTGIGILLQEEHSLEQRLLGLDHLLRDAARRFGKGLTEPSAALAAWGIELAEASYQPLLQVPPCDRPSLLRQRAVLAPFLGRVEEQWQTWGLGGGGVGTRLTLAILIANGVGPIPLGAFNATLDQSLMRHTVFPQDDSAVSHLLTRYLRGSLQRGRLIDGTDVLQGFRYLLLSFAAARWYAVARAALASRRTVEVEDVREGIRLVEKTLGHALGLRSGATQRVVRFLFRRIAAPATMIHNFYEG